MIKKTIWSPDTCNCVIEYEWDTDISEDKRTHTLSKVINACPVHSGNTEPEVFSKVTDENTRKNLALSTILDNIPEIAFSKSDALGNVQKALKEGINYGWSFDSFRNLHINFDGANLTPQQKGYGQQRFEG